MIDNKQFLFVVGAPRSGTSWLHHMLAEHPDIAALDKELTVIKYLADWAKRYRTEKYHLDQGHWQQGMPLLYGAEEFTQHLRRSALDAYGRILARNPQATHVLDKHPYYAMHIPLIHQLFPRAKILHIIRDGREVAVSMMSAKRRIGFGEGEIRGAAWAWARHVCTAQRDGRTLGKGHYLEVHYEDLKAQPATHLKAVFDFCQLPNAKAWLQQVTEEYDIRNKQVSRGDASLNHLRDEPDAIWKARLGLEERWVLDRIAGPLLYELGYAKPGWWVVNRWDKPRMATLRLRKKLMNTLGSAKHTWNKPLADRFKL